MTLLKEPIHTEEIEEIDYDAIASSEAFTQLLAEKKKFIVPYTIFYIAYSVLLPLIAFYSDILNVRVIGDITLAWVYGVSFIPISLGVCNAYVRKAAYFDQQAKEIIEKEGL